MRLVTEAGIEAIKALTLSEDQIQQLAAKTAAYMDTQHKIAPPESPYAKRLQRLVAQHQKVEGHSFQCKAYISPQINAFALADGNIRFYSGLMDMLNDEELLFVLGHEMGHVFHEHTQEKMQLALAGRALRKGLASQQNILGDLARSGLGGFAEQLFNAQFSQEEEKQADDFGLQFMKQKGYNPAMAVSALKKLATLGSDHSFLSTHPAPEKRAKRLQSRLQESVRPKQKKGVMQRAWDLVQYGIQWVLDLLQDLLGNDQVPGEQAAGVREKECSRNLS
jgi:putative metalloprotease